MGIFLNMIVSLALLSLLGVNIQGAPTKGRYMWVKCSPDSKNANCVPMKGPWMKLPGPASRLPPSAVKEVTKEQSDDGSGIGEPINEMGSGDPWKKDGSDLFQTKEGSADLEGTPEFDYSDFVFPEKVSRNQALPFGKEFQDENLIL